MISNGRTILRLVSLHFYFSSTLCSDRVSIYGHIEMCSVVQSIKHLQLELVQMLIVIHRNIAPSHFIPHNVHGNVTEMVLLLCVSRCASTEHALVMSNLYLFLLCHPSAKWVSIKMYRHVEQLGYCNGHLVGTILETFQSTRYNVI